MPTTVTASRSACKPPKAKVGSSIYRLRQRSLRRRYEVWTMGDALDGTVDGGNACTQGKCMSERNQPGPGPEPDPGASPPRPGSASTPAFATLFPRDRQIMPIESLRNKWSGASLYFAAEMFPRILLARLSDGSENERGRLGAPDRARRDGIVPLPVSPLSAQSPSICSPRTL